MAYTLQFGNTWKESVYTSFSNGSQNHFLKTCFELKEKIGYLSPALCIQEDVLYPNALASVSTLSGLHPQLAVGCKGNQLDNEFPLEPRVQTCLPLVQYPSFTNGSSIEECDMCAKPVLNWQNHINELKRVLRVPLGFTNPKLNCRKSIFKSAPPKKEAEEELPDEDDIPLKERLLMAEAKRVPNRKKKVTLKRKIDKINDNLPVHSPASVDQTPDVDKDSHETLNLNEQSIQDESENDGELPEERANSEEDVESNASVDEDPHEMLNDEQSIQGECENDGELSEERAKSEEDIESNTSEDEESESETPKPDRTKMTWNAYRKVSGKIRDQPTKDFKKYLFEEKRDLEGYKEDRDQKLQAAGDKHFEINKPKKPKKPILKPVKVTPRDRLPVFCIRKYKNLPELRIQGTWNHLYGGNSGACATMESIYDKTGRNVFVGCGTQLRMASLKPSKADSMLSYQVDSVWEEEKNKVPTNIRPGRNEPLSDLIYGIVPDQKNGVVAVRRGKSVEIYDVSECPNLVYSTPNICYGRKNYKGWKLRRFVKDPLLLSVDLNPYFSGEMITMDENLVVQISSITEECSMASFIAPRDGRTNQYAKPIYRGYPNFKINEAPGGVLYTGPQSILTWLDSCVYSSDRRQKANLGRKDRVKIFELRQTESSLSWSDQTLFQHGGIHKKLNEFVSCVKKSENPYYYYIGTTSRLFMMDWRVPDQPVMKMTHGMRSAATYIDTYHDGNYEVLVAGAQRTHETCCLVTDHAHASCIDRPGCKARNPIMMSYPRHLSNSRDFHHETQVHHMVHSWPSDLNRTKDHNYAWTTGMTIFKLPRGNNPEKPPGVGVFTGNHYGDIFYQEWDQSPIESERKTVRGDPKLKNFLAQWHDFMETKPENYDDLNTETCNPKASVDVSLCVKTAVESIPNMYSVRTKEFDIFKPDSAYDFKVKKILKPLAFQVARLRKLVKKEARSTRILSVWEEDWQDTDISIEFAKRADDEDTAGNRTSDVLAFSTDLPDLPEPVVESGPFEETQSEPPTPSVGRESEPSPAENALTEQQAEILSSMKHELEEENILPDEEEDDSDDSEVLFCGEDDEDDDGEAVPIITDEINLGVNKDTEMKEGKLGLAMSQNAQRYSTQDLDEMGFPGLADFYPVASNPSHILPDDGQDDFFRGIHSPYTQMQNRYGTIEQDDNMNFGGSQVVYSQEMFSSQPNSQQFLFHSATGGENQDQEDTKVSPFPYNPLDTGPGPSGISRMSSQSQSQERSQSFKKPGF